MTGVTDRLDDKALRRVDAIQVENLWMLEYARANYKNVNHPAFIKEVQGIMAKIPNMTMKKKSGFKAMQDLKVEGNTASATAVTEDGKTEKLDFVQVDGIWHLSIQTSFMK